MSNAKQYKRNIYIFDILQIIFLLFIIISRFVTAFLYDYLNIQVIVPGHSTVGWVFTQFTWWTTILFTIIKITKIFITDKFSQNNKFTRLIFSEEISILFISYILIVGTLFFVGVGGLLLKNEIDKNNMHKIIQHVPAGLKIFNFIITILVHAVNPIWCLIYYIITQKNKKVKGKISLKHLLIVGMAYPVVYLLFYLIMGFTKYDPYYPVTNLKEGKGWYVLPIVIISFQIMIYVMWMIPEHWFNKKLKKN